MPAPPRLCSCGEIVAADTLCACQRDRIRARGKRHDAKRPNSRQRGYVQSMDIDTIWADIDHNLGSAGISSLPKLSSISGSPALHVASHEIIRSDASSPFHLHHIWVDLRASGTQPASDPSGAESTE